MSLNQKVVTEPTAGVSKAKICLKIAKKFKFPIYNAVIPIPLNFSIRFCVFLRKHMGVSRFQGKKCS